MSTRPTLDERMDLWLNLQADRAEIPDVERQRFIDHMRGTTAYAATRLGMQASDLREDASGPVVRMMRWVRRAALRVKRQ